jgi:hypothetical protein
VTGARGSERRADGKAGRTRRHLRWHLAFLALAVALTVLAGLWAPLPEDPLEAARRRVPPGVEEDAVTEAVGRLPDGVIGKGATRPS